MLLEAHSRLLRLAVEMGTKTWEPAATLASGEFGLFERISEIVSEHYQEPLSIPKIARTLQISRTHVMRHFRKVTGMSVLEYIT